MMVMQRLNFVAATLVVMLSVHAAVARQTTIALSIDEPRSTPSGKRELSEGDYVRMNSRGLKRIEMTANAEGVLVTNTGAVGIQSSGNRPGDAWFVTEPGSTPPADVAAPFPGGIVVSRGIGMMRGWRPMIRTPRTTTVAPGSCLAVEVIQEKGVERIALLQSETLSDPAITGPERDKHLTTCWLDSDNTKYAKLDINQFVEVRMNPTSREWDFVRDFGGNVIIFKLGESDREKFESLAPRLDCTKMVLK